VDEKNHALSPIIISVLTEMVNWIIQGENKHFGKLMYMRYCKSAHSDAASIGFRVELKIFKTFLNQIETCKKSTSQSQNMPFLRKKI